VSGSYDRNAANTIRRKISATTSEDGRAQLPRFPPGKQSVDVYLRGYTRTSVVLRVDREPVETEVTLVQAASSITGTITLPDGTPATGGLVGFGPEGADRRTAIAQIRPDGSFTIKRASVGAGRIDARADGFGMQSWPITVVAGGQQSGLKLRLAELGKVTGRVEDRTGRPLVGVRVALTPKSARNVGTASEFGSITSGVDGGFVLRGLGDGEFHLRAQSTEWIPVNSMWFPVRAGTRDLIVKMKPASEGSGIKLVVIPRSSSTSIEVTGVIASYSRDGLMRVRYPRRGSAEGLEFRLSDGPGTYDITFTAPGFLPFVAKGVRVEDRLDNPPLEVHFDRGATLRVTVLDDRGTPYENTSIRFGNEHLRTDENGECEVGGFEPGVREIRLMLGSDRFTYARVPDVRVPGRAKITLRRHAQIWVRHSMTYGELKKGARWKLLDAEGRVVAESVLDMSDVGRGFALDHKISGWLQPTRAGEYRLVAELDDRRAEQMITVTLGTRTTVNIEPR